MKPTNPFGSSSAANPFAAAEEEAAAAPPPDDEDEDDAPKAESNLELIRRADGGADAKENAELKADGPSDYV